MKKVLRGSIAFLVVLFTCSIFVSNAEPCYKAGYGGFKDIGGTQVFVCPSAGTTPCLYLSECNEE